MSRFALLLLVPVSILGACHVSRERQDGDEKVSINADESGKLSFSLPFARGDVTLPRAMFESGHFDIDGVKMIPGATIHGFNMNGGDKGATVHLAFAAPNSPDAVRSYFLKQFRDKGDKAFQAGNSISGTTRDGDEFAIDVEPAAGGSSGTISIRSKD